MAVFEHIQMPQGDPFQSVELVKACGRITSFIGTVFEVEGINGSVGEYFIVRNESGKSLRAEVIGFKGKKLIMMPFAQPRGFKLNDPVFSENMQAGIAVGDGLLGKVIDPFGQVLGSSNQEIEQGEYISIYPEPCDPLSKKDVEQPIITGISAIDGFLTIGKGQRVGIFAGSGVGKTSLFKTISKASGFDVKVVCLIGERGREVVDFVDSFKNSPDAKSTVIIAATSDQPALKRAHAIFSATAIAEYFAAQNKDVLLMVDSITRHALAQREIGLALGEPPTLRGFTPSVFAQLPLMVERAGNLLDGGSVTAIYTVLVEGGDIDEPISDTMRSILDGHIVLSRELADLHHFPAIDILSSRSRVRDQLIDKNTKIQANHLIDCLTGYRKIKDFIELGGYRPGDDEKMDKTVNDYDNVCRFLTKNNGTYQGHIGSVLAQVLK